MSLFLHGVVREGHRLPEGSPFRLVGLDEHAVVVSDRRDDHGLTEQEATAHLAGLCALLPGGPVLPLRIGTTAVDEAAARAAVVAFGPSVLRHNLERLDGVAEMHVRLVFDEDIALRAVHAKGTFTARGGDLTSTIAQGELIAREIVAWRRNQVDAMLAPVAAMARSVALVDAPEHTEEIRAFLVRLDRVEAVRNAVTGLGDVVATCAGPLPAFHFLEMAPRVAQRQDPRPASRWGW